MITRIKGNIVTPCGVICGSVYSEDGIITAVTDKDLPFDKEYDCTGSFVMPGLIDVHTHGAARFDYSESDADGILAAVRFSVQCGATSVMPTITSSTFDVTYKALESLEEAMADEEYGKCIIGAHLEGPYFSQMQCGAHANNK